MGCGSSSAQNALSKEQEPEAAPPAPKAEPTPEVVEEAPAQAEEESPAPVQYPDEEGGIDAKVAEEDAPAHEALSPPFNKEEFRTEVSRVLKENNWLLGDHQVVIGENEDQDNHTFQKHAEDTGCPECVCLMSSQTFDNLFGWASDGTDMVHDDKWELFKKFAEGSDDFANHQKAGIRGGHFDFVNAFAGWVQSQPPFDKDKFQEKVDEVLTKQGWLNRDGQEVIGDEGEAYDLHTFQKHEGDTGCEECVCLMSSMGFDMLFRYSAVNFDVDEPEDPDDEDAWYDWEEGAKVDEYMWRDFVEFASTESEQGDMINDGSIGFKNGFQAWVKAAWKAKYGEEEYGEEE